MQDVGAVGEDVCDRERWRKIMPATATPQGSENSYLEEEEVANTLLSLHNAIN